MSSSNSEKIACPACGSRESGAFCSQCGAEVRAAACAKCAAPLKPGARFCASCGTPTVRRTGSTAAAPAAGGREDRIARLFPWAAATLFLAVALVYLLTNRGAPAGAGAPVASGEAPFANGGATTASAPDISNMSPRERAGRLYDRIMRYAESGQKDSLTFFGPMAMATYQALGAEMDLDARYDYGRVASETGSLDVAAAQADTILAQSPTHLLGLALRARTAQKRGDARVAKAAWSAFLAAKEAEMKKALPEYQAHANDIVTATGLAGGK